MLLLLLMLTLTLLLMLQLQLLRRIQWAATEEGGEKHRQYGRGRIPRVA